MLKRTDTTTFARVAYAVPELLEEVALDPLSLQNVSQTCKFMRRRCDDKYLWQRAAAVRLQVPVSRLPCDKEGDLPTLRMLALHFDTMLTWSLPTLVLAVHRDMPPRAGHARPYLAQHLPQIDAVLQWSVSLQVSKFFDRGSWCGTIAGIVLGAPVFAALSLEALKEQGLSEKQIASFYASFILYYTLTIHVIFFYLARMLSYTVNTHLQGQRLSAARSQLNS